MRRYRFPTIPLGGTVFNQYLCDGSDDRHFKAQFHGNISDYYLNMGALHGFLPQVIGTTIESADDKRLEDAVRAFKHRSRTTDEQVKIGDRRIVDMRVPSGYSWLVASPVSAVIDMRVSRSGSMQILSVLCILHELEQGFQLVFARAGERREKLSDY